MQAHADMNVFYVTNGLTQWAAAAVKNNRRVGSTLVFGYERTEMTYTYISRGDHRCDYLARPRPAVVQRDQPDERISGRGADYGRTHLYRRVPHPD